MTKVLSIGTDRNIFKEGEARTRQIEYGRLFQELHIIVFSRRNLGLKTQKISENTWVYPTNSLSRYTYVYGAKNIGEKILKNDRMGNWVITAQDPFETGLVASHLSSISGARLNLQVHTDFLQKYFIKSSFLNRFRVRQAKRFLKNANSIRVVSSRIKNSLNDLNRKIKILPMFVDIRKISESKPAFDLHKKHLEFDFIVLSVARLESEKNFSLSFQVFAEVLKDFPKTGFVIVGDGQQKKRLRKLVKKLGLGKNIKFEGQQDETASYYKTTDLYLNTSFYEGYSRSLVEAAAGGCPILSTNVGPIGEVLSEGEDVLTCDVKDKSCFVEKIKKLISDQKLRKKLSEQARRAVIERAISKEEYLSLYRDAIIGN